MSCLPDRVAYRCQVDLTSAAREATLDARLRLLRYHSEGPRSSHSALLTRSPTPVIRSASAHRLTLASDAGDYTQRMISRCITHAGALSRTVAGGSFADKCTRPRTEGAILGLSSSRALFLDPLVGNAWRTVGSALRIRRVITRREMPRAAPLFHFEARLRRRLGGRPFSPL
jgi:hypothetical protein